MKFEIKIREPDEFFLALTMSGSFLFFWLILIIIDVLPFFTFWIMAGYVFIIYQLSKLRIKKLR